MAGVRTRIKLAGLSLMGRSPFCGLGDSIREYERHLGMESKGREISQSCCLTESGADGLHRWSTPEGDIWAPESTDRDGLALILAELKAGAYASGQAAMHSGDVVLDCGANIGLFSRSAIAGGASQVVAVEPFSASAECVRRNLAPEIAAGRVVVYQRGLWDEEGRLPFIIDPHNAGGNSFITMNKDSYKSNELPVTTIDGIVKELGLAKVDFIKMDIEAAEQRALAGAAVTLQSFHPRMAIAVEHTPDRLANAKGVIRVVQQANPSYRFECGLCYVSSENQVLPEILYFY